MTIKLLKKFIPLFLFFAVMFILSACGGGGSADPKPQKVTATFALQGSPATLGSVQLNIVLPDSFVLETNDSNLPTTDALTFLVPGAVTDLSYTPANAGITAAIIKSDGFPGTANLMQISRTYVDGEILPTVDDFIMMVTASDFDGRLFDGTLLPEITGKITIDIQPAP